MTMTVETYALSYQNGRNMPVVWKGADGNIYIVLGSAINIEDGLEYVIYAPADDVKRYFVATKEYFFGQLANGSSRFTVYAINVTSGEIEEGDWNEYGHSDDEEAI